MKKNIAKITLLLLLAASFVFVASVGAAGQQLELQPLTVQGVSPDGSGILVQPKGAQGPANYIIQLSAPSVASYTGGINGLAATNPRANGQVDLKPSAAVDAYVAYLTGAQQQFAQDLRAALGRTVEIRQNFQHAFNGVVVQMNPDEAAKAAQLSGVRKVFRETIEHPLTDVGPEWIGAFSVWDGSATGTATEGEDVVVAILDTGINHDHPSFADVGGDGYDHTNPLGSGNYIPGSYCVTDDPTFCNDKVIGAWDEMGPALDPDAPEDNEGHGSHTASTTAGNMVEATLYAPTATLTDMISGVAPHANIIMYDVCVNNSCPGTALLAAVNQVVVDHMYLLGAGHPSGIATINYSISGGNDPYNDSVSLAFLAANDAGVHVSASAGNAGPNPSTMGHQEPWTTSVGAMTHNRNLIDNLVNLTSDGGPLADMVGAGFTAGYGPALIVYAGNYGDPLCPIGAFAPGTFSGQIVICDRGTYARVDKGLSVLNGGAGGMVLADNGAGLVADGHYLPATHISQADGAALKAWVAANTNAMGTITGAVLDYSPSNGDIMAGFSSRGPNDVLDVVKPNVAAPGASIWAAVASLGQPSPEYAFYSGTSMSSPHDAGAAALLTALHPDWTPQQIQSALMTTALNTTGLKEDGVTPADPWDYGAGRIRVDMAAAAGLVLDETEANFSAADPNAGGDPKTLNVASMMNSECTVACGWQRTVMNPTANTLSWTTSFDLPAGMTATVTPDMFTLAPGESVTLDIQVDVSAAAPGAWLFAQLNLTAAPMRGYVPAAPAPAQSDPAQARETLDSVVPTSPAAPALSGPQTQYVAPEAVLYDNGPLITCPGCGAGGADISELQTALGMNTNGFGHAVSSGFRVADDFTIPAGETWTIDQITFFAYQTNSGNTSTINHVNLRIWDGVPGAGGSAVVFGDTSTNRLNNTAWSGIYRTTDTDHTSVARPLMADVATVGVELGEGTYWLDWQTGGTLASGPWAPPISILGQSTTGNGLQYNPGTATWGALLDGGSATPQGLPFIIEGTAGGGGGSLACNGAVDFAAGIPGDWAVADNAGNGVVWGNLASCGESGNFTGGAGDVACASSDVFGEAEFDTEMWTNAFDLSAATSATLNYLVNYQNFAGLDRLAVDVSTDGGSNWTNLLLWNSDHGAFRNVPGEAVSLNLTPYVGNGNVIVRWHYYDDNSNDWDWYAQVDDVALTCEEGGGGSAPDAHMPIAVVPTAGSVPDLAAIHTRRDAGSQVVGGIVSGGAVTDLTADVFGLTQADVMTFDLAPDPTNGQPFDNLSQVYYQVLAVPADSYALIAELMATTALDNDLYVGFDTNGNMLPDSAETVCTSASGAALEMCEISMPAAGNWWVLLQNWQGSGAPMDSETLATAVVPMMASGNMWVEGPMSVPGGTPFDVTVYWDITTMLRAMAGDVFYGAISLGTDPGNPGNIGTIPVRLYRDMDDVTKTASTATAMVGDTVTYTITVQPNITPEDLTYMITDTLPAGMTLVPGSASATAGTVSEAGNVVMWTGVMPTAGFNYAVSTTASDPSCVMPLATSDGDPDGYVNLQAFGILTNPTISGDTFDLFVTNGPYEFFGANQGNHLHFTDDGFAFFEPATPGASPWVYQPIPTAGDPDNMMATWWRDWVVNYNAGLNYGVSLATLSSGGVPVASLIEYDDVQDWPGGGTDGIDFEFVIYFAASAGRPEVIMAYKNLNNADLTSGTIGVESPDGTDGEQVYYDDIAVTSGSAVCYDWVQASTDPVTITYQATANDLACNTTQTNVVEHVTDNPGDMVMTTSTDVAVFCPLPAIELAKTVGTDPNACATTDSLQVNAGDTVYYCYTVTNTGNITLTHHDLTDDQLGVILSGFVYDLGVGASVYITQSETVYVDVTNMATWTAYIPSMGVTATADDSATVTVIPTDVSLASFGGTTLNSWLPVVATFVVATGLAVFVIRRRRALP